MLHKNSHADRPGARAVASWKSPVGGADAQAVAEATVRQMNDMDAVAPALGISVNGVGPGFADISMSPTPAMVNGVGIVHGGYVFLLADIALAYASNSHGEVVVAQSADIEFLAPAHQGKTLRAIATERRRLARGGLYDVAVTDVDGTPIAELRGHCRRFTSSSRP